MSLDVEVVIGVSGPVKDQVDQQEITTIFQLVVPTLPRGVTGRNGRHCLYSSLRYRVQVVERRIISDDELQVDVRVSIHGTKSRTATLPPGEDGRKRP